MSRLTKNNFHALTLQISYSIAENSEGYVMFKFKNVPIRKLDEIESRCVAPLFIIKPQSIIRLRMFCILGSFSDSVMS